jgi:L,D-transpeptidase YcbB
MKHSFFLFPVILFSIICCQKKTMSVISAKSPVALTKVKNEKTKKFPDLDKFTVFLNPHSKDSARGTMVVLKGDSILIDSLNLNVYRANNFNPFWSDSAQCHQILRLLNDSRFDGLNPSDYGLPGLENMFSTCFMVKKQQNDTLFWKLELAITKNYLKYLNHLRFGKVNPEVVIKDWDYKRDPGLFYTAAEFAEFFTQNPGRLVSEFRPRIPMYNVLRAMLFKLDSIGKNNTFTWDKIPYIGKDLNLNDTSWVVIKIKQRLLTVSGQHEDSSNVFNEELLLALNYFQQHTGLTANGKIDKSTVGKLNFSIQETKDLVRVNMERCRWLLIKGTLPDNFIVVNIADYSLRVYKNKKQVYRTRVVVGATDKATPLFHSSMSAIEFNPYWTVPSSIAGAEILPRVKTDPDYLSRNNMELLRGDALVEVTDFSSYTKDNFPFVIRQRPGKDNSLGLVKFLFPNPYSVYFHDTPSKSLFEKDTRAFSHGCIRVQKPLDLAAFILSDEGFSTKQISDIIEDGKNYGVALKTKIPVIITYWTCFSDSKDHVFFLKDIYGRDKIILRELNKKSGEDKPAKNILL